MLPEDIVLNIEHYTALGGLIGDCSFLLTPRVSQVARLGDQVAQVMAEEGGDLEDLLEALDQERELYYREHC